MDHPTVTSLSRNLNFKVTKWFLNRFRSMAFVKHSKVPNQPGSKSAEAQKNIFAPFCSKSTGGKHSKNCLFDLTRKVQGAVKTLKNVFFGTLKVRRGQTKAMFPIYWPLRTFHAVTDCAIRWLKVPLPSKIGEKRGVWQKIPYFRNYVWWFNDSKCAVIFIVLVVSKKFLGSCRNFYRPSGPYISKWVC